VLKLQVRSRLNPTEMDATNSEVTLTVGAGGAQPRVVHIDLVSPVSEDPISVGRGGPTGLPGKGRTLRFKFAFDEVVGAPVAFTAQFTFAPPNTFESFANFPVQLGGTEPSSKESAFIAQATAIATNGTLGTLVAKITRDSDGTVFDEKVINLKVQK
jgi:hypothetical protein